MKRCVVLLCVLLWTLIPQPVAAWVSTSSANITIEVTGWVADTPGFFTITYISDTELELSWIMGNGAVNTMVRAAFGRLPDSRTDGYLVYYGNSTLASDTALDLDEIALPVYYRAWSENALGVWEEVGTSGFMEGPGMKLIALVVLCLGMLVFAWHMKKVSLMFMSLMCWMGFTAYMYTLTSATWDYYRVLAWFGIGMSLLTVYQVITVTLHSRGVLETPVEPNEEFVNEYGKMVDSMNALRVLRPRKHRA